MRDFKTRQEFYEFHGNKCVKCGRKEGLEIDHIDPGTRLYKPGDLWRIKKYSYKRALELSKCQVLCKPCHIRKTVKEIGYKLLNQTQIDEIFRYRALGAGSSWISKRTKISEDIVWRVLKGLAYKDLSRKYEDLIRNPKPDRLWRKNQIK